MSLSSLHQTAVQSSIAFAVSAGFQNVDGMKLSGKLVKKMHKDNNCNRCVSKVSTDICNGDDITEDISQKLSKVTLSSAKNVSMDRRKSRKSVCIVPRIVSSSESSGDESDPDNEVLINGNVQKFKTNLSEANFNHDESNDILIEDSETGSETKSETETDRESENGVPETQSFHDDRNFSDSLDSRKNVTSDNVVIEDTDVVNDSTLSDNDVNQIENTEDKSPLFVSRKIPKASVIASSDDTESDIEEKAIKEKIRTSKKVLKYAIKNCDDEENNKDVIFSSLKAKLFEPEEKIETDKRYSVGQTSSLDNADNLHDPSVSEGRTESLFKVQRKSPSNSVVSSDDDGNFDNFISSVKKKESGSKMFISNRKMDDFINDDTESLFKVQRKPPYNSVVSSADDGNFDNFISSVKKKESGSKMFISNHKMDDFINDDTEGESSSNSDNDFMASVTSENSHHRGGSSNTGMNLQTPFRTPRSYPNILSEKYSNVKTPTLRKDVLEQMQTPKSVHGTPAYKREFNKMRDTLIADLFKLFNETVFDNKLPSNLKITWNKRMTKTAGYCYYSISTETRDSKIELSDKVIDNAERARDTLIHELCHAAAWVIDGKKAGHGPAWKYWAKKANHKHPDLPIISRCHQYEVHTKYNYQCNGCGQVFGRHSKSIDASRHRCSKCGGIPELINSNSSVSSTPKTPNPYALFLKENFASVKKANPGLPHKELMQKISAKFREVKLANENKEN